MDGARRMRSLRGRSRRRGGGICISELLEDGGIQVHKGACPRLRGLT